jgi:transcriptional regulator with XRE-family HTH domain
VGPWSFAIILASDILTWAVQQASKEGVNYPAAVYLDHLAERVGLTQAQLFRILAGDRVPTISQLVQLCQAIGSARAVEFLAEDCGLRVCDRKVCGATEATEPGRASRAA